MPDATAEEAEAWSGEYHSFLRGRVARVQDQARAWLGVMTTMLSLFSLLVLVNKGQSLSDLPVPKSVRDRRRRPRPDRGRGKVVAHATQIVPVSHC